MTWTSNVFSLNETSTTTEEAMDNMDDAIERYILDRNDTTAKDVMDAAEAIVQSILNAKAKEVSGENVSPRD